MLYASAELAVPHCCVCIFCFIVTSHALAQFDAGVQGSVKDSSGALVPGALVTLTSRSTNRTSQVTANDEGFYRFLALAPGEYTLKAEKTGFEPATMNIVVRAEATQGFDIVLNLAGVTGTVTVTEAAVQILETEDANINKTITTQEVLRLPQVGRDPYELARLAPGVSAPALVMVTVALMDCRTRADQELLMLASCD